MANHEISDDEHARYASLTNEAFGKLIRPKRLPSVLFHYTTGPNLISIIRDGQLWCTQISCLNDEDELLHGLNLVRAELKRRLLSSRGRLKQLYENLLKVANEQEVILSHIYVACFSKVMDDLNQWRAYGGDAGGYSLGLSRSGLRREIDDKGAVYLAPVIYELDAKSRFINAVLDKIAGCFRADLKKRRKSAQRKWIQNFSRQWIFTLCSVVCLFKSEQFSSEKEWRLIVVDPSVSHFTAQLSHRSAMFRRHIVLRFKNKKLPIVALCIGPSLYPHHGRLGVKQLLLSTGYNVPKKNITNSNVPLRRVL